MNYFSYVTRFYLISRNYLSPVRAIYLQWGLLAVQLASLDDKLLECSILDKSGGS